jgi:hypothetical protein
MLSPTLGAAQEMSPANPPHRFWEAAGGILAANGVTWGYNWYIQRWKWSNVGTRTWAANLRDGFVWDNDCFMDNQLAHPYHGTFYHSSARASGYGFWSSLPFVAAGSASWELFFENVRPSLNDFVNTTLGGLAMGEVTFRLSSLLTARKGGAALGRELGAFALSPLARVQDLLLPEGSGFDPRRPAPASRLAWIAVGTLRDRVDPLAGAASDHGFVELAIEHGSPFDTNASRPYDAFELNLQLSRDTARIINRIEVSGLLARYLLPRSGRNQIALGLFQHYDYHDALPFDFGGQSVSGAVLYHRKLGSRVQLNFGAHLEALLLGAVTSDHGQYFRRDYDYGPGAGGRFQGSLRVDGRELLHYEHRLLWIHSLHGAAADHLITAARIGTALPLGRLLQLGGDIGMLIRHSSYRGLPSTRRSASQLRAYLVWSPF